MIPSRILTTYTLFSASVATWLLTTPLVAHAQPVRGLYINGEGGATFNQNQRIRASAQNPQSGRDRWHTGGIGIGSIGWGLGNGFRVELEGNYRSMAYKRFITDAFSNGHVGGRRQTYALWRMLYLIWMLAVLGYFLILVAALAMTGPRYAHQ